MQMEPSVKSSLFAFIKNKAIFCCKTLKNMRILLKIKWDSSTTNNEIYYFYLLSSSPQVSNNSHSTVTNCSISQ